MPSWVTSSPNTRSKTKSLRPWGESIAKLVGEVTWTIDRWNRCGMSSNPGSVGFSGGRTRTAIDSTVSLYSIPRIRLKLHTNFDRCFPILVRSATATTTFARHAHSTGCSRRPHHRAHRPRGNARGRPRRRAGHGSKESFVATKCNGVVKMCYGRSERIRV